MLTKSAHINISREDHDHDNTAIMSLYPLPPGSRVVIYVGRRWPDFRLACLLGDYVHVLHLDLQGEWSAVERWENEIVRAPATGRSA